MTDTQTTPDTSTADALRGPWTAVMAYPDGYVIEDIADLASLDSVEFSIRRRTALPDDHDGVGRKLPEYYDDADVIESHIRLGVEWGDIAGGVEARWVQWQAMAAGLNAAGGEG